MRIVFLHAAEQDLIELKAYVVQRFGKTTWRASYKKIKDAVGKLESFPLASTIPDELIGLYSTQYRQVVAGMNRIIYEVREQTIFIHIVCDARKDMASLLMRRLLRDG